METHEDNWPEMQLTPVGIVKSEIITPMLTAGDSGLALQERMEKIQEYHRKVQACVCELTIFPQWGRTPNGWRSCTEN